MKRVLPVMCESLPGAKKRYDYPHKVVTFRYFHIQKFHFIKLRRERDHYGYGTRRTVFESIAQPHINVL